MLQTFKFYLKHAKKYVGWILLTFVFVFLGRVCEGYINTYYKIFIDILFGASPKSESLISIIQQVFIINVFLWMSWRVVTIIDSIVPPLIVRNIVQESYDYLQHHSYKFFTDSFAGSLVKKITRLSDSYLTVSDTLLYNLYPTLVTIGVTIFFTAQISPMFAYIVSIWTIIFLSVNVYLVSGRMSLESDANKNETRISGFLADTLGNFINVISFSSYHRESKQLEQISTDWRTSKIRSWIYATSSETILSAMMLSLEFFLFYFGIIFWKQGQITPGDFVMLQGLLRGLFMRIWDFGKNIRQVSDGLSRGEEMIEIMNTKHEVQDVEGAIDILISKGEIEIKHLNFKYNNSKVVFDDFSLHIPAGKKMALVAKSGSGKSTLIKLLLRFYNVTEGSILIDGQDIIKTNQESLRRQISFVSQEPVLFHRTLAENIAYGKPDASEYDIIEASKKAHCHEFISQLPEKYNTYVGERGIKLSGGERQRVAIARAILQDSKILILDEATSSLDSESEKFIQEALEILMKEKTTIVIAHRLSTIHKMDEIIVIEQGKILERGTHTELINNPKGQYRYLWEIQSGEYSKELISII